MINHKLKLSSDTYELKNRTDCFAWLYENYICENKYKAKLWKKSLLTPFQKKELLMKKTNDEFKIKIEKKQRSIESIRLVGEVQKPINDLNKNKIDFCSKTYSDSFVNNKKIPNVKTNNHSSRVLSRNLELRTNILKNPRIVSERSNKSCSSNNAYNPNKTIINLSYFLKVTSQSMMNASHLHK